MSKQVSDKSRFEDHPYYVTLNESNWVDRSSDHPAARSISDDDLCAGCRELEYCPGELSMCARVMYGHEWPAEMDGDRYATACTLFVALEKDV